MNSRAFRRSAVAVAAFSASAIVLAGCAGGAGGESSADSDEQITLTLATFNDFGYTDELLQEYMDENPNIKIVHNKAADLARRPHQLLRQARQGGPRRHRGRRDRLVHRGDAVLRPARRGARQRQGPLARLEGSRRDRRRRSPRRLRHRHRPAGICYRADLFEAAGLPSTPDEVAALFDGDWSNFFDVADQYKAATGKPMIDSANSVLQGMVNQIEFTYDEPDGTVIATDNPEIEDAYNLVVERADSERGLRRAVERRLVRLDGQRRVRRDAVPARGCSASSRATHPTSPAGTSPTRSPTAAATGAVRT